MNNCWTLLILWLQQNCGVIVTNTISREGLQSSNKTEMGGLSGKPLTKRSTEVIRFYLKKQ
jgi:dihydroorotate dehydrogenase